MGQRLEHLLVRVRLLGARDQVDDDFRVHRRLKDRSLLDQPAAQLGGVGQIAVVGKRQGAVAIVDQRRLGIAQLGLAGRRVARVTDGDASGQIADVLRLDRLGDQAHPFVDVGGAVLAERDDASGLLSAVLQRIQPEKGELGRGVQTRHTKDPAFLAKRFSHHGETLVHRGLCPPSRAIVSPVVKTCAWNCLKDDDNRRGLTVPPREG